VTQQGLTEDFYRHVGDDHVADKDTYDYSPQERLAIEYAERFVLDHTRIDDDLFGRLRARFTDAEILDLTICVAAFLGLGRLLRVLGIDETGQIDV
jgi:alkylhydroperoxidase family enzyme